MRGEGVSLSGKPTLPYPKIESRLLVLFKKSSVVVVKTSARAHTHTRLRYTAHEEMCVFVYVNTLLLPTGRKNAKVHKSHYSLCTK
jgi:hypothetical protein